MERKQVITIHVDGSMSGLQVKPGRGILLTDFGPAKVVRASEIAWSELYQKWFIDVLQEAGRGPVTKKQFADSLAEVSEITGEGPSDEEALANVDDELDCLADDGWQIAPVDTPIPGRYTVLPEGTLLFTNYDQAVSVEIAYLDRLRLAGEY